MINVFIRLMMLLLIVVGIDVGDIMIDFVVDDVDNVVVDFK
jgi:hypothetical protein